MSTPTSPRRKPQPRRAPTQNILLFLIAFRLVNAFAVRTFFQPDEYFQSLEPAWQIAFGQGQGAWVTWEWRHQLRSSLHPLFFAALYKVADFLAFTLSLSPATRAELLIAAPKTAQAVVAAIGDFYTWKLAVRVYGDDSLESWTTLVATVVNPWQWFCSTRTLSNSFETTITIVALELWPWQWSVGSTASNGRDKNTGNQMDRDRGVILSLHECLPLAALACILRPTNILVWATLAGLAWLRTSWPQRKILLLEVMICGSTILAVSSVADRLFYGIWTFPPLRFLYFNIAQSLAIFYGSNDWHYYISQGYPLLLTTLLPFALTGLYRTLSTRASTVGDRLQAAIRVQLATVCLLMPFVLSLISHKEVRFIYPLLPCLHILAAPPLMHFFYPAIDSQAWGHTLRRLILIILMCANVVIALYTTLYHASGTLSVLSYLRHQHEAHSVPTTKAQTNSVSETGISVGFLMPCHSTPWRSHLVYPTINAWALSCEPPIDLNATQKAVYRDEADQFYDDTFQFLRQNMTGGLRHLPRRPSYASPAHYSVSGKNPNETPQHEWPDYLIFFAQLEPTLYTILRTSSYGECWRTYNSDWHDDWRRRGDIVVWCLDTVEQDSWRSFAQRQEQESREKQFDRIVEAFKSEGRKQKKRGWMSSMPWAPAPPPLFASWRHSLGSFFSSPSKSSTSWPWRAPSRWETVVSRLSFSKQKTGWLPSWVSSWLPGLPSWLGGAKRRPTEAELWS
ncbi:CAZyme family GT22 [Penicillium roqueforti]|uniref:Mannosyltransferase n=1 Tax=Penicillium roqueforti (strain FM164) TaxID=1365484 RepID=W6QAF6_PENRF|nr:CAZyme family GT22 [Penicillium roqueforti]CDM33658.1 GPI mannosyltransferase 3 [Penicillium roqueforti FM164]KAF9248771.1 CAZyme family GT22 [Penicillium roqueforti]KAI1831647.1 CAZyme family GT22 [Penicillium roqueforti]KAI2681674.1 CAZyme family GT22 [Penicillium roqueforti]KAI2689064.1 CAZyme family GT22 [Penicillium roqueforti]